MTTPTVSLDALRNELRAYSPNAESLAELLLPFINEQMSEAYLAGTISQDDEGPHCPIPGCGSSLYLMRTLALPVTSSPTPCIDARDADGERWRIECGAGHVLDGGSPSDDSRDITDGWRSAQKLGESAS